MVYILFMCLAEANWVSKHGHSRHDCTSLVQEEQVRDSQGGQTFSDTRRKAHEDACSQGTAVCSCTTSPSSEGCVEYEGRDIGRSAAVLCDERHPYQVSHALEKSSGGEEIGNLGNFVIEIGTRWTKEGLGGTDNGDRRSSRQEVAEEDGAGDEYGDVETVWLGPISCLACFTWPRTCAR